MKPLPVVAAAAALALASSAFAQAPGAPASVAPAARTAVPPEPTYPYQTSTEHYLALKQQARGGARRSFQSLPDWSGIWIHIFTPTAVWRSAPLKPEAKAAFEQVLADVAKGQEWDHASYCLPASFPRTVAEPFVREFVVRPEEVWMINESQSEVRRVYINGEHPPADELFPLWEGHSIGFWDGDSLVVHTTSVRGMEIGYFRNGPPQSNKLSAVERWRRVGKDTIEMEMTVYDPDVLTRPWTIRHQYERVTEPGVRIDMWACNENNNLVREPDGATHLIFRGEPGYQDPESILNPKRR